MLNRIRDRFGTAGLVVAVLALIAALTGTAIAAGGLNALQKKQVKAIAKSFQGTGPAGAAGPAGPAGANGARGDTGANGTNGANGKTVLNGTGAPTAGVGTLDDFYIDTSTTEIYGPKQASGPNGGWGTPTELEGPQGDPWTLGGTLPAGETLTGTWSASSEGGTAPTPFGVHLFSISIPIPLAQAPSNVIYVPSGGTDLNCTGLEGGLPTAPSGTLCIYEEFNAKANGDPGSVGSYQGPLAVGAHGGHFAFQFSAAGAVAGSWAVTG
jgi:hypothetical protein